MTERSKLFCAVTLNKSTVSALLLGDITEKKTDFETGDLRPLTEIMRDKWFTDENIDCIRDCTEFKEVIELLCE